LNTRRKNILLALVVAVITSLFLSGNSLLSVAEAASINDTLSSTRTTPIKHLIVIFQENVSFDHYFATYPHATNPSGEPHFHASSNTPSINNLTGGLLINNTNVYQPFRFDRSRPVTCDMNHSYTAEQNATNGGLMDKFVNYTSPNKRCTDPDRLKQVMGYFDGNTVTALWTYA
jgi:phospholipase C